MATTTKTDMLCKLLSKKSYTLRTRQILLKKFQEKIQVFWVTVSHIHCSLLKTTSTLISEELGISLSTLKDIVPDWPTKEPERKILQQQNRKVELVAREWFCQVHSVSLLCFLKYMFFCDQA